MGFQGGKELFFLNLVGALMRVPIEAAAATWIADTPIALFVAHMSPRPPIWGAPTTSRLRPALLDDQGRGRGSGCRAATVVVQHVDEELKRLAPAR